jgi:hypothetical protein
MKRFMIIAVLFLSTVGVAMATISRLNDDDRHITFAELPAKAQSFIKAHFTNSEVSYATMDRDFNSTDYEVVLSCGTKIEFDGDGEWKEVDCRRQAVSSDIVPKELQSYVDSNYPTAKICDIQRDQRGWDIQLTSGLELEFDKSFRLVGIDD